MLKLAALGGLGYAAYKYYQKNGNPFDQNNPRNTGTTYSGVSRSPATSSVGSDTSLNTTPTTTSTI